MVEKPHPTMPAITVGEPGGPLLPFVQRVVDVLKETGALLLQSGYLSIGMFLAEGLNEAKGDPEILISRLVRASPPFDESFTFSGQGTQIFDRNLNSTKHNSILAVYTYQRAIHLVLMIADRFSNPTATKAQGPAAAAGPHSPIHQLPAVAHDALATAFLQLGIVDVAKSSLEPLRPIIAQISDVTTANETPSKSGNLDDDSTRRPVFIPVDRDVVQILHAASIYACDVIAKRAQMREGSPKGWDADGITAAGLSAWFSAKSSHVWTGDVLPRIVVSMVS